MSLPDTDLLARLPELSDEEKHQRTLAGLADVEAGRTITHEEMLAWAQSLFGRLNSAKVMGVRTPMTKPLAHSGKRKKA